MVQQSRSNQIRILIALTFCMYVVIHFEFDFNTLPGTSILPSRILQFLSEMLRKFSVTPRLPLHLAMAVEIRLKITFSIDLELNFIW